MTALTNVIETSLINTIIGSGSGEYTVTTPIKAALMTANGSDSAAGTEVTGGSYARQSVTWTTPAAGAASNASAISFASMPACVVRGVELWDSGGTPKRIAYGALAVNKTVNAGDTFQFSIGSLTLSLD